MRRRHVNDPPVELLRAARAEVLPEDLQTSVSEHLSARRDESHACRRRR